TLACDRSPASLEYRHDFPHTSGGDARHRKSSSRHGARGRSGLRSPPAKHPVKPHRVAPTVPPDQAAMDVGWLSPWKARSSSASGSDHRRRCTPAVADPLATDEGQVLVYQVGD